MIFTSGSTGRPKGVMIEHASALNMLAAFHRATNLEPRHVFAAVTTVCFDISVLEIFLTLTVGATLEFVVADVARDGDALLRLLRASRADVLQATPSTWRLLLDARQYEPGAGGARLVETALCGGEPLPKDLADKLVPAVGDLLNVYGPTEARQSHQPGRRMTLADC